MLPVASFPYTGELYHRFALFLVWPKPLPRCRTNLPSVDGPRLQKSAQHPCGLAPLARAHQLLGRTLCNDAAAGVTAAGPEVDDPVGLGDHVQVVLDEDDAVAGVYQAVQDADQAFDVGHVQADGGLVEDI